MRKFIYLARQSGDELNPAELIADCFDALRDSEPDKAERVYMLKLKTGYRSSLPNVIAKRLCAKADAQLESFFSLPQSKMLREQRPYLEETIWKFLDVTQRLEAGQNLALPSPTEVSTLRWFSHSVVAAGSLDSGVPDESFDSLRNELKTLEAGLDNASLESNFVAAIRVEIRHINVVLADPPVDVDMLVSRMSSLIGTLAICARNSEGKSQKWYAGFFQRMVAAIAFEGFSGAVSAITADAMQGVLEGTIVAPGEDLMNSEGV